MNSATGPKQAHKALIIIMPDYNHMRRLNKRNTARYKREVWVVAFIRIHVGRWYDASPQMKATTAMGKAPALKRKRLAIRP